jgi:hypothetical protein
VLTVTVEDPKTLKKLVDQLTKILAE